MHIDIIDSHEDFTALRPAWDALYAADPDAQVFLSWTFMSCWLETRNAAAGEAARWVVLVARRVAGDAGCSAILPLRLRPGEGASGPRLTMAGRRFADYTGLLSQPDVRDEAIAALAQAVKRLHWQTWQLECLMMPQATLARLLAAFPPTAFAVGELRERIETGAVDNTRCPRIELPDTFDTYLAERLSANSRQKLRRLLRQTDRSDEFRISLADEATVERDLRILLQLWKTKWQSVKGARIEAMLRLNATVLLRCFRNGTLRLPVLWHGRRPIGALAFIVDEQKRAYHFVIAGRDEGATGIAPGLVLHARSIQQAIEAGMRVYDFQRGNEPYKYSLGGTDRRVRSLVITRRARIS